MKKTITIALLCLNFISQTTLSMDDDSKKRGKELITETLQEVARSLPSILDEAYAGPITRASTIKLMTNQVMINLTIPSEEDKNLLTLQNQALVEWVAGINISKPRNTAR